jgi:hypothetical protein
MLGILKKIKTVRSGVYEENKIKIQNGICFEFRLIKIENICVNENVLND